MSKTPSARTGLTAAAAPVLALDASTDYCSVGVACGGEILYAGSVHAPRRHSEVLHPLIAEAFERLGWEPPARGPELLGIGVTVGPGSFTGLRIGIAAATGLATAWGLRVAGLSSLAVLAAGAALVASGKPERPDQPEQRTALAPALSTRTGDCYAALFSAVPGTRLVNQVGPVTADRPQAALEVIVEAADGGFQRIWLCGAPWQQVDLGDNPVLARLPGQEFDHPRPGVLAVMAGEALARGEGLEPQSVTPIYVRRSGTR